MKESRVASIRAISFASSAPSIATIPGPVVTTPGTPVVLSLAASGSNLTYQWFVADPSTSTSVALQQDGQSNTFTFTPQSTISLVYARVTDNDCGTFSDMSGYWTIISSPPCGEVAIANQPAGATIAAGDSATLSVTVSASCPLTYQWFTADMQYGWTPIAGATSATLTVSPTETTYYKVNITTPDQTTLSSNTATVKVK